MVRLHLAPALDKQGRFDVNLGKVLAGKLPVPQDAVMGPARDRALRAVRSRLPAWQQGARISPSGIANQDAMYASLAFLMMHTFNHEPGDPVLYLPSGSGLVPAKLTQIS